MNKYIFVLYVNEVDQDFRYSWLHKHDSESRKIKCE